MKRANTLRLLLMVAISTADLLGAGCAAWESDRRSVIPGQSNAGGLQFNVTRVVGMGTTYSNETDGRLKNPALAIQNGVLDKKACVGLNIRVKIQPKFLQVVWLQWEYYRVVLPLTTAGGFVLGPVPLILGNDGLIYGGSHPLFLPITVKVNFNGKPLLTTSVRAPIQASGFDKVITASVPIEDAEAIKFAVHRSQHIGAGLGISCPFSSVGGKLEPANCPGSNQLTYTFSVDDSFEQLQIGLGSPEVTTSVTSAYLSFSAMPPILLVPGCCGDNMDFWYRPVFSASSHLVAALSDSNMPVFVPAAVRAGPNPQQYWNAVRGTIQDGGREVATRVQETSRWFGAKWVHIVGHSKGGLNARHLLGTPELLGGTTGVRSLITMNTPHHGSGLANFARAVRDSASSIGQRDRLDKLMAERQLNVNDLNVQALSLFNKFYPSPPRLSRAGNYSRPVSYAAYVSDANADASDEPSGLIRSISLSEAEGFLPDKPLSDGREFLLATYNYLGRTGALNFSYLLSTFSPHPVPSFFLNDGAVESFSQAYMAKPPASSPFAPISSPPVAGIPRGVSGANHEGMPTRSRGELLVDYYKNLSR